MAVLYGHVIDMQQLWTGCLRMKWVLYKKRVHKSVGRNSAPISRSAKHQKSPESTYLIILLQVQSLVEAQSLL